MLRSVLIEILLGLALAGCAVPAATPIPEEQPTRLGMPVWVVSRTNACQASTMKVAPGEGAQTLTFRNGGLLLDTSARPAPLLSSRCAFTLVLEGAYSSWRTVQVEMVGRQGASLEARFKYQLEVGECHEREAFPPLRTNTVNELITFRVPPGETYVPVTIRATAEAGKDVRLEIERIQISLPPANSRGPVCGKG